MNMMYISITDTYHLFLLTVQCGGTVKQFLLILFQKFYGNAWVIILYLICHFKDIFFSDFGVTVHSRVEEYHLRMYVYHQLIVVNRIPIQKGKKLR